MQLANSGTPPSFISSRNVVDQVKYRSNLKLALHSDNVAGVSLPIFKIRELDEDCKEK